MKISRDKAAEICELYLGSHMPPRHIAFKVGVSPATVTRTINNILQYKKIEEENTEMIKGFFDLERKETYGSTVKERED